jgi:hypothetical protein
MRTLAIRVILSCALLMVLATWSPTHAQCGSDDVQLSARQIAGTAALLQWTSCGGPFFECFKIKDDPSSICSPEAKVQVTVKPSRRAVTFLMMTAIVPSMTDAHVTGHAMHFPASTIQRVSRFA